MKIGMSKILSKVILLASVILFYNPKYIETRTLTQVRRSVVNGSGVPDNYCAVMNIVERFTLVLSANGNRCVNYIKQYEKYEPPTGQIPL